MLSEGNPEYTDKRESWHDYRYLRAFILVLGFLLVYGNFPFNRPLRPVTAIVMTIFGAYIYNLLLLSIEVQDQFIHDLRQVINSFIIQQLDLR